MDGTLRTVIRDRAAPFRFVDLLGVIFHMVGINSLVIIGMQGAEYVAASSKHTATDRRGQARTSVRHLQLRRESGPHSQQL